MVARVRVNLNGKERIQKMTTDISSLRVLTACIITLIMAGSIASADQFSYNFDNCDTGIAVVDLDDGFTFKTVKSDIPLGQGKVRRYSGDVINQSKVLEHKSDSETVMTRIVNTRMRPMSGDILFSLDICPRAGLHQIYLWDRSREQRLVISLREDGRILSTRNEAKTLHVGDYKKGHWLHIAAVLHMDPNDGQKSTYDLWVTDLNEERIIACRKNIPFPGAARYIRGGQVLSGQGKEGLDARIDNWQITPLKASQARDEENKSSQIMFEGFALDSLGDWEIQKHHTNSHVRIAAVGQLSPTSLQVDKSDYAGDIRVQRLVDVPAGSRLEINADIQSVAVRPFAEYFLLVEQLRGNKIVKTEKSAFDDGVTKPNNFGGYYKSPQTLGEWKTTRHIFETKEEVTKIRLSLVFQKGSQVMRVDNLRIRKLNKGQKLAALPIYQRSLNSAAAFLDLDMLLPGCVYEIRAKTESDDLEGFGARLTFVDLKGKRSEPVTLIPDKAENRTLKYCFAVPDSATRVLLDLYNSDLKTMGAYRVAKYRKWQQVAIYKVVGVPAMDTLVNNYIHKMEPDAELTRPRVMVEVTDYDRTVIDQVLRSRTPRDARVENHRGGMAVRIGEKLHPPMINTSFWVGYDYLSEHGKHGFDIARIKVPGGPGISGNWIGQGHFDFSNVDDVIYQALKQNENALIILDIGGLYPPAWWGESHPEELIRDVHGRACCMYGENLYRTFWGKVNNGALQRKFESRYGLLDKAWHQNYGARHNNTYLPSPASEPYRDAMREYIRALIQYIESKPIGNAVIGYHLTWGEDTQWKIPVGRRQAFFEGERKRPWKSNARPAPLDYSQPMLEYFRVFLRQKYGSDESLQSAWNDPSVTLATAEIPTPAQRTTPCSDNPNENIQLKFLLNPATEMQVIDYNSCYARVVGDLVNEMGLAVKNASSRQVITTAYFQGKDRDMGHEYMLRGAGLDISGGPDYWAREIGQSGISPNVFDSFRLHGKIDFTEVDHRVFPVVYRSYSYNQLFETPEKTISVLRREFARQMCRGGGAWTLDLGMGWFNHPMVAAELGNIHDTFEQVLDVDRSSPAEMAIFINDYSYYASALQGHTTFRYHLAGHIRALIAQSGVPVSMFYLSDLPRVADQFKVFIFPHAYALTDEQRRDIHRIKRDDNLLVFGPGSGYVGSDSLSVQNVCALTGMEMEEDIDLMWTAKIANSGHPVTREWVGYFGNVEEWNPRIAYPMLHVTDPNAVVLGSYVADDAARTAIALKDHGAWQSLYVGAMGLFPVEMFRGLAKYKGLHVYSDDGDVMYFASDLVAIHASTAGIKDIRLPSERSVRSLWDGRDLGRLSTIRRNMQVGENALYLLGD
jgi:beta-galactosidase